MSTDLVWFVAGVAVGTFAGIGLSVVAAWWIVRGLVRLALLARGNRMGGGPTSRHTV